MLKLRLARAGMKKRPFYHLVVAEARAPRDGRFVEKLGTYDPRLPSDHQGRIVLNTQRVQYWLGKGAQPTERVALFLGKAKLAPMPAVSQRPLKSAPGEKAKERLAAKAEKAKQHAENVKAEAEAKAEAEKQAAEAAKKQVEEKKLQASEKAAGDVKPEAPKEDSVKAQAEKQATEAAKKQVEEKAEAEKQAAAPEKTTPDATPDKKPDPSAN